MFGSIRYGLIVLVVLWVAFTLSRIGMTMLCQVCSSE